MVCRLEIEVSVVNVQLSDCNVALRPNVCSLGVHLDSQLTMRTYVQHICRSSFYQLRQLRSIHPSLSETSCSALLYAFITSRLDYCNSLLARIRDGLITQRQSVMRVAARLVLRRSKFDPISADIRDRLHWLPIRSRIVSKLGILAYKCLHGNALPYLVEMLQLKSEVPALRRIRSPARGTSWFLEH